nr:PREDICTED: aquaporin-8 isoform X2 [Lepisosteus oculatus]
MSRVESKSELFNMSAVSITEPEKEGERFCQKPNRFERYVQPCLAELLGSALFIFVGCSSVIENVEGTGRLQPALAHGLALGIVIAVLGEISGGHFNPAVSLSVYLTGGVSIILLLPYVGCQLCGGLIGAALAKAISTSQSYANASGAAFNVVQSDEQIGPAVVAETVMTLFLTMVRGRVRGLHEPCPCFWASRGGKLLGLPLDLLGRARDRSSAHCLLCEVAAG